MSDWQTKRISPRRETRRRHPSSGNSKWELIGRWLLGALVVFAIFYAWMFVLPRVEITIFPETRQVALDDTVILTTKDAGSEEQVEIPVSKVSLPGEVEASFVTTGTKDTGERAHGNVVFSNLTGLTFELFVEDGLETIDGIEFVTTKPVSIPAARVSPDGAIVAGTVTADVVATEPGEESNIPPQKIFIKSVSADKQHKIYAQNEAAFSGGTTHDVRVISEEDVASAQESLRDLITHNIKEQIEKELDDQEVLIPETFELTNEVFSTEVELDQELEEFKYRLKATGEVVVYRRGDIFSRIKELIQAKTQAGEMIVSDIPDSITFDSIERRNEGTQINAHIVAAWSVSRDINIDQLKAMVLGKRESDARRILLSQPSITDVRFKWTLALDRRVPNIASHVNLVLGTRR